MKKLRHAHRHSYGLLLIPVPALIAFLVPASAWAYIDPNTGGYAFQILFPILSAIGVGWVFFRTQILKGWHWLLKKIGLKSRREKP